MHAFVARKTTGVPEQMLCLNVTIPPASGGSVVVSETPSGLAVKCLQLPSAVPLRDGDRIELFDGITVTAVDASAVSHSLCGYLIQSLR